MKDLSRIFGVTTLIAWAGISSAQIATGWTLPGHHAPIVRGGDGIIRMDAVNAYSPRGVFLWSKSVGDGDLRATTDGLTYACWRADLYCLNSSGGEIWKYRVPNLQEKLASMRVSGDYLWIVGTSPITVGQVTRYGVSYKKFDRRTGAVLHSSEFLLSTDPTINEGAVKIVGNGSANFVVVSAKGADGTLYAGVARMDLETGEKLSSTFFPTGGEPTGAVVDSQNQIYIVDGTLRKFDGSATPAITQVWARNNATGSVFISKGRSFQRMNGRS